MLRQLLFILQAEREGPYPIYLPGQDERLKLEDEYETLQDLSDSSVQLMG